MKPGLLCAGVALSLVAGTATPQDLAGTVHVQPFAGPVKMVLGKVDRSTIDQWGGIGVFYQFDERFSLGVSAAYGWVYPKAPGGSHFQAYGHYKTLLIPVDLLGVYSLRPGGRTRPFVTFGLGVTDWDIRDIRGESGTFATGKSVKGDVLNATLIGGVGIDALLSDRAGLRFALRWHQLLKGDESTIGGEPPDDNRAIIEFMAGLCFYFGGYRDTDGDGIEDKYDLAPNEPEDLDGFEDADGVPDPDNDNDGILDAQDKAPNDPEDRDGFQDNDGIPDPDNDGDGIRDVSDRCSDLAEDFDGFEDNDGCPDLDNDGDGILDRDDKCPNELETVNQYQDDDGCPDEVPEQTPLGKAGEKVVFPGIQFRSGSAEIDPSSYPVLDEVVRLLKENPEIEVEIRGHTDNTGSYAFNMRLSQRRAEAVRLYLIQRGIAPHRLRAVGYGPKEPIASNDTPEGRALNRRIEFVRIR